MPSDEHFDTDKTASVFSEADWQTATRITREAMFLGCAVIATAIAALMLDEYTDANPVLLDLVAIAIFLAIGACFYWRRTEIKLAMQMFDSKAVYEVEGADPPNIDVYIGVILAGVIGGLFTAYAVVFHMLIPAVSWLF